MSRLEIIKNRVRHGDGIALSPLHVACIKYDGASAIKQLISEGADVDKKNYNGETPLHYCVNFQSEVCVKMLIDAGVDVNATSDDGSTPLHFAASTARCKNVGIMRLLMNEGAMVNAVKRGGWTVLHHCIKRNNDPKTVEEIVKEMIERNVNVNIAASNGATPLCTAVALSRRYSVVVSLLTGGADVDALTNEGTSPLAVARTKIVNKILFEHKRERESVSRVIRSLRTCPVTLCEKKVALLAAITIHLSKKTKWLTEKRRLSCTIRFAVRKGFP
jgi:ankyrin repeat protein